MIQKEISQCLYDFVDIFAVWTGFCIFAIEAIYIQNRCGGFRWRISAYRADVITERKRAWGRDGIFGE
jgi:hypothetical protein